MGQVEQVLPHKLIVDERKKLTATGVTEVIGVDEGVIVLQTGLGRLVIQGQNLKLKNLSPEGQATVDGNVCALTYEQVRQGGALRRLFG